MSKSSLENSQPMMNKPLKPLLIAGIFKLLRPKQWIKNGLVFAALVFSKNLFDGSLFLKNFIGFMIFCALSSCVYILNDMIDKEKDRAHSKKCKRPIASGAVSLPQAGAILLILLLATFSGAFLLDIQFAMVACAYFLLNVLYSFKIKNIPILDMMFISMGFVLRALAGTVLINYPISPWLMVCTMLLALFLAIHKRKSELEAAAGGSTESRSVLEQYSSEMLRDMSSIIDSATIIAYCLYTFSTDKPIAMMCTIPFVIYGLFRYQFIIHNKELAETPELALIQDKPLLINILLWCVTCIGILYLL